MIEKLEPVRELLSGLAGSMVAVIVSPPERKIDAFAEVLGGFVASVYLTEPVWSFVKVVESKGAIGFLTGLFAMAAIRFVLEFVRRGEIPFLTRKGKS